MRDLIRQIVEGYTGLKLKEQSEGFVMFTGEEPDTHHPVWIKILPRLLTQDPTVAQRVTALSQAIRQLNHPNIVAVRQVGEQGGLPYLITRALEQAQPLAAKLNQPWAVDTAADIVMQVGQALEHAHAKGLVHGSLSPDNIVVENSGRVQVTDFGLAELQDLAGVHVREAVSPYLAPERQTGARGDSRSDVYSLAAILYSLVAQRNPQVVRGQILPPSRFNPDVPEAMDAVVIKALAPNPADRYPDIKSFLAAFGAVTLAPRLQEALPEPTGVTCRTCGTAGQTGRFCRKCGARLDAPPAHAPTKPRGSILDEPIQRTRVEVGRIEVGKGVEIHETVIARPVMAISSEMGDQFPELLEMPQIDAAELWSSLSAQVVIPMPEPLPMPAIDWAEVAPPMPQVPTFESSVGQGEDD